MSLLIIDDANAHEHIQERERRMEPINGQKPPGCQMRRAHYGTIPGIPKASSIIQPIPRSLWPQLIATGKGTFLHDLTRDKLPPHDQGSTNYCWAHGSVRAAEVTRVFEGQSPQILSAESVAVPITGGQNRGGYPEEALTQLIAYGAAEQSYWPLNDRNIHHAVDGWQANALNYRILQWVDVDSFDMQMTLGLMRIPVAIGLGWWGHLVCQLDPVQLDNGQFGIGCDNSWGPDYGDNGYFILEESRATADLGAFAAIANTFFAA